MKKINQKQLSVVSVKKSNDSKSQSPLIKNQKHMKNQSKVSVNTIEIPKKQKLKDDQKVWGEMRVKGKMILSRSNHISIIHQDYLYVHGGKNNQTNAFHDIYRLYLKGEENKELQSWELVDSQGPGLKRHSAVLYQDQIIMLGGLDEKDQQNSIIYCYNIIDKQWTQIEQKVEMEGVDSQSIMLLGDQIIMFGGFKQIEGKYQNRIDSFNLQTKEWSNVFQESMEQKSSKIPMPRSNCSMVEYQNKLYILGGMNGNKKCDDFWEFDLQSKQFREMHNENTPQMPSGRSGHKCVVYNDQMVMFGGIQQITQEKNDLHVYDFQSSQWKQLYMDETQTEEDDKLSIYNTDNIKMTEQNTKKTKQTKRPFPYLHYNQPSQKFLNSSNRKQQDFMQSSRGERTFNAIEMQKDKERLQSKQNLLSLFEVDDQLKEELRVKTPHTEAMRSTLMTIKHTNNLKISNLILEQDEKRWNDVENFNKIPCPRDGHSICLAGNRMIIFGGDRHKMSFNDLYILELDNIKQIIR